MRNQQAARYTNVRRSPAKKLPEPDPARKPSRAGPRPRRRDGVGLYVKNGGKLKKLERCSAV